MAYSDATVPVLPQEDWQPTLAAHAIVVVHFWVSWSPPDLAMSKVIQQVRPDFAEITFFYVDIAGDGAKLANHFGAFQTPVLVCFLNGQEHARSLGFLNAELLRAKLREWLAAST